MAGMIEVMRSVNFDCERTAELLNKQAEQQQEGETDNNRPLRMTPLLEAATLGLLPVVKDLLSSGADANTLYGIEELSLLDVATLMGHPGVVRALLEHGVNVNDSGPDSHTALLHAVLYGRADLLADIIDLLLSAGADIDAPTIDGFTPLHLASYREDCDDMAAVLLRHGADKNAMKNGVCWTPLHVAAKLGNVVATRALLAAGADATLRLDAGFSTKAPLDIAARFGQAEVIREFARHGVDVNAKCEVVGFTALSHAARKNHAGAVDALVEAGARVTAETLDLATYSLAFESTAALLRHGAPISAAAVHGGPYGGKLSPLHIAASKGGTQGAAETVDLLLRWGADESELDYRGKTPSEIVAADLVGVSAPNFFEEDADRVRVLLANAPADRTWRRRGMLLMCLARNRNQKMRRSSSGSWGKEKGAEEGGALARRTGSGEKGDGMEGGALAKGGAGSGDGGGAGAVPSRAVAREVSAAVAGSIKRERVPFEVAGGGGFRGVRSGGGVGNGDGFDGVAAMLSEFEEEGFFRTIVSFL